ncbi:hypothetical protein ACFQX6_16505 [Streptosporangium lutulentum]
MIDILVEPGLVRGAPEPERTGHGPLSHRLPRSRHHPADADPRPSRGGARHPEAG